MSQQIIDTSEFPALVSFSKHWETIRDEALQLDRYIHTFDGTNPSDGSRLSYNEGFENLVASGSNGWVRLWGPAKEEWLAYSLCREDRLITELIPESDNPCPKTMALFKRLHGVKIATLNIQKPGGFTLVHTHSNLPEQKALIYHLPLSVPDNWHWLNIEGTFIQHRNGESFIFDGSKDHFALNFSQQERLILYMEFYTDRISFDE